MNFVLELSSSVAPKVSGRAFVMMKEWSKTDIAGPPAMSSKMSRNRYIVKVRSRIPPSLCFGFDASTGYRYWITNEFPAFVLAEHRQRLVEVNIPRVVGDVN